MLTNTRHLVLATAALLLLFGVTPATAATCESLATAKLSNGTVTMAQPVAAGAFTQPGEITSLAQVEGHRDDFVPLLHEPADRG